MVRRLVVIVVVILVVFPLWGVGSTKNVLALGTPQITVIDPPSPQPVGTCVKVKAKVNWDGDFRSMRMRFGNEGWQEEATPEFERTFCTSGYSAGWYTIRVEVARQGDNSWSSPTSAEASYQLTGSSPPPTQVPPTNVPAPSCQVDSLSLSPSPATVGQDVRITGSGSCSSGVRAARVKIDGGVLYEIGAPSLDTTWHTSGASVGQHTVTLEIAGWGDNEWKYAASRSQTIQLTSPVQPTQVPPPTNVPAPSCQVDSLNLSPSPATVGQDVRITSSGSCSSGVRAMRVKVDGGGLYEIGAPSLDIVWHTSGASVGQHTITVEAAGWGDNEWRYAASRSQTIQLTSPVQPTQVPPSSHFSTGDVIQIGYDVFVIVNGQRRLVPNPETLDALGITRNWINNKGLSDDQLRAIPRGPDIPDVVRDPGGFWAFKNWIFPNTVPIVPPTAIPEPTQPPPSSHFSTGDVIQIGYDVFVIVNGQRRLVPNPATLDALGITRSWINNRGLSDAQLREIPRGPDIPDVVRDPGGFWAFKNWIFPNTVPIVPPATPKPNTPVPPTSVPRSTSVPAPTTVPPPAVPTAVPVDDKDSDLPDNWNPDTEPGLWEKFLELLSIHYQVKGAGVCTVNPYAAKWKGQCTWFVAERRPDICLWLPDGSDHPYPAAYLWDDRARAYEASNSQSIIHVSDKPSKGAIAVWEQTCAGANRRQDAAGNWYTLDCSKGDCNGHVAYVTSELDRSTNSFTVVEMNWPTENQQTIRPVKLADCMSFISLPSPPTPIPTPVPPQPPENPSLLERLLDWLKKLFGF